MPTQTPLTDAINALTTYANTVTGASDTNLSDAVATLGDGYGGGGGNELAEYIASGVFPNGDYTIDNVTTIAQAFSQTSGVITLTFPDLTTMRRAYAFDGITATRMSMPKLTNLYPYSFSGTSILTVFAPLATLQKGGGQNIDRYHFNGTSYLQTVVIGSLGTGYIQFYNCTRLTTVDIVTSDGKIDNSWQTGCANFNKLILRGNTVLPIYTTTSFDSSCFKNGGTGGTLYVPQSLISSYQSDSNWSTILGYANNSITAIEGSQYENYYADGTPIE